MFTNSLRSECVTYYNIILIQMTRQRVDGVDEGGGGGGGSCKSTIRDMGLGGKRKWMKSSTS